MGFRNDLLSVFIPLIRELSCFIAATMLEEEALDGQKVITCSQHKCTLKAMNNPKIIVISQSMYFPWCGIINQASICDTFVHYDDVQFARGFLNRVQIKTEHGMKWLTVPLAKYHRGQLIDECLIDYSQNWVHQHREALRHSYSKAPYYSLLLDVFDAVVTLKPTTLGELGRSSIRALITAFELDEPTFLKSSDLGIGGRSSKRLCDITSDLIGDIYLTGLGALNYLDQNEFLEKGIDVMCMKYRFAPWQQFYGSFTPYVTALDCSTLWANSKEVFHSECSLAVCIS